MKTKSVINALCKIMTGTVKDNVVTFTNGSKQIVVIDQKDNAICLPMINQVVVHNGNHTIKNLISFITDNADKEKIEYLKLLRKMYSTTSNESRFGMLKDYQPMKAGV